DSALVPAHSFGPVGCIIFLRFPVSAFGLAFLQNPAPLQKNCFTTVPWHCENRAVRPIACDRWRRHVLRECKTSMSTTYRAVEVTRPGLLQLTQRPLKEAAAGQVRIRVEACGVCHSDSATVDRLLC